MSSTTSKIVIISILFVLFALPASAAYLRAGEEFTLKQDDVIEDDLYVSGGNITISGKVTGDIAAVGGNILINGSTTDDVIAVGGAIDILGPVGDDVRASGGQIRIGENISGDVVAAGGFIHILSGVTVSGDVVLVGGKVIIDGTIEGQVKIYAGDIQLNGTILGDTQVFTSGEIEFGEESSFGGDVSYTSPREALIPQSVIITGNLVFNEAEIVTDARSFFSALFGAVFITKIFTLLTAGLLVALLFQRFSQNLAARAIEQAGIEVLRGLIMLVIIPALSFFLIITLLGFLIGSFGFILFAGMLLFTRVAAGIVFGALLARLILKRVVVSWQWVIVGITLLEIIKIIPIIGWLVAFVLFLMTFGSLSYLIYRHFWFGR